MRDLSYSRRKYRLHGANPLSVTENAVELRRQALRIPRLWVIVPTRTTP